MVINAQSQIQANRLDTIRFSLGVDSSLDHLIIGSEGDLLAAKQQSAPAAHVIRISDLNNLKALPNCIVDCCMQKRAGDAPSSQTNAVQRAGRNVKYRSENLTCSRKGQAVITLFGVSRHFG